MSGAADHEAAVRQALAPNLASETQIQDALAALDALVGLLQQAEQEARARTVERDAFREEADSRLRENEELEARAAQAEQERAAEDAALIAGVAKGATYFADAESHQRLVDMNELLRQRDAAVARAERAEQERDKARDARDFIGTQDTKRAIEAEARVRVLEEALREEPSKWSFETLLVIAERLLAENYGPEVFDGSSGDPGPELVVALRAAVARCRAALAAAAAPPEPLPERQTRGYLSAHPDQIRAAPPEKVSDPGASASLQPGQVGTADATSVSGSLTSPAAAPPSEETP